MQPERYEPLIGSVTDCIAMNLSHFYSMLLFMT